MNLEELVDQLRRLRDDRETALRGVATGDRGAARRWLWAAAKYDRRLVEVAGMVSVPARLPRARRLLGSHARFGLEAALGEMGLDLGYELAA